MSDSLKNDIRVRIYVILMLTGVATAQNIYWNSASRYLPPAVCIKVPYIKVFAQLRVFGTPYVTNSH